MIKITLTLLALLFLAGCELMPQRQVFTTENSYISTRKPSVQFNIPSDFISLGEHTYDKAWRYSGGIGGSNYTNSQYVWVKTDNKKSVIANLTINDVIDSSTSTEWYSLKKWRPNECDGIKININGTYFETCTMPTSNKVVLAGWQQVKNSPYSVPECSYTAFIQYIPLTSQHRKLRLLYSEPVSCDADFTKADSDRLIDNAVKALGGS